MPKTNKPDFETPIRARDDEDEATLAAIDEGLRDAREGRVFALTEARRIVQRLTEPKHRKL